MLTVIAAILAMAAKDAVGTFMVIAEARGRSWLAGTMDAAGDLANIACTILGAGAVITQGVTPHSLTIIAAMVATSLIGTALWTRIGRHIDAHPAGNTTTTT